VNVELFWEGRISIEGRRPVGFADSDPTPGLGVGLEADVVEADASIFGFELGFTVCCEVDVEPTSVPLSTAMGPDVPAPCDSGFASTGFVTTAGGEASLVGST
jgi:hypothetical protein